MKDGDACYVDLDGDGKITADDMTRDLGWTDDPQWVAGLNMGVAWRASSSLCSGQALGALAV